MMLTQEDLHQIRIVIRDETDPKFKSIDQTFKSIDQRFDKMDQRMDRLEGELHRQGVLAEEDRKVLAVVRESVVATNERLDRMVSVEPRVARCEEDIAVLRQVVATHVTDEKRHPSDSSLRSE